MLLRNGFTSKGEVRLLGAQIGGHLACIGGTFVNEGGHALSADGINVKGDVFLRNGFTAKGEVRLLGAQIGGTLECNGGTFANEGGDALSADRINVKGYVFLGSGKNAEGEDTPFTAKGEVRLLDAQIGSNLDCDGGTFENKNGNALHADRINVKGSVFLQNGFTAEGKVRLLGAQIGGDLACIGGTFANEGGYALSADGINVKGNVFLRSGKNAKGEDMPFTANGAVLLPLAQIDGQIDCSGARFTNPGGDALNAFRAVVKSTVFLSDGFSADDRVYLEGVQIGGELDCRDGNFQKATLDLTNATAGALIDSGLKYVDARSPVDAKPTKWPPGDADESENKHYLILDGFVYGRIASDGRLDVDKRLAWLERQPKSPFRMQPYLQLAKILRDSGDKRGALRVLEKMEDLRRDEEDHGALARLWGLLLKWTIGYGYHPKRAVRALACLILLGWFVYAKSYPEGGIVPTEKEAHAELKKPGGKLPARYPAFSAPIYSLENSLPLVKLDQAEKWQPDPAAAWPPLVRWFLRLQILLGWLLATFFVAGVTGIVHKE